MEVRTPSPLPHQPGMDTGFDPPGQPTPPRLSSRVEGREFRYYKFLYFVTEP